MKINITLDITPAEILELANHWGNPQSGGHRAPPPPAADIHLWWGKMVRFKNSTLDNQYVDLSRHCDYKVKDEKPDMIQIYPSNKWVFKKDFYLLD